MADQIFTRKDVARFFAKTRRDEMTGCLIWTGCRRAGGYGGFWVAGKPRLAHRVAWAMANGSITPGACVLHHCDNPPCVEVGPGHLFLGDRADNAADMVSKGRQRSVRGDEHWSRLHPERVPRGDSNGSRLHPERLSRGAAHYRARLTEDTVRKIRESSARGESDSSLGRRFGVSRQAVWHVRRGAAWRHVT